MSQASPIAKAPNEIFVRLSDDRKKPYDMGTIGFALLGFYNAVLGRLLTVDGSLELQPHLLQKGFWDYARKRYVLILRDGLRFHNGRAATARDLEFSLVRHFLTRKRADPVAALKAIRGVEKLQPGQRFRPGMVDGLQVVSDTELHVELRTFTPSFLHRLTEGWLSLVPLEELEADYVTWKRHPIGAGPYKIIQVDATDGTVRTERVAPDGSGSPHYVTWISSPDEQRIDVVGFRPANPLPELLRADVKADDYGYSALFFNPRSPLGANVDFRTAVALALDRRRLVEGIPWVEPLSELLLPQFPGRLNATGTVDIEKARAALRRVPKELLRREILAYPRHGSRAPIPFEERYAEVLRDQLAPLGLKVRYVPSRHITFDAEDRDAVFRLDNRGSGYADALMTFRPFGRKGFLSAFYPDDDSELESALEHAEVAGSRDDYSRCLLKLSQLFAADKYVLPLFKKRNVYWVSPRVETVGFQYGVNFDVEQVKLK